MPRDGAHQMGGTYCVQTHCNDLLPTQADRFELVCCNRAIDVLLLESSRHLCRCALQQFVRVVECTVAAVASIRLVNSGPGFFLNADNEVPLVFGSGLDAITRRDELLV